MPSLTVDLWLQDAVEDAVRKYVDTVVRVKHDVPANEVVTVEVKAGRYEVLVEWDVWSSGARGCERFTPAGALRLFLGQL